MVVVLSISGSMLLFRAFFFSKDQQLSSNFSKQKGFFSWKKLNPQKTNHDTSPFYKECMREYLNQVVQLQRSTTIDAQL